MTLRAPLLAFILLALFGGLSTATATAGTPATSAVEWPGSAPARVADAPGALGANISGLAVAGPASVWAVRDAPGALLALDRTSALWLVRAGWGDGRALRYSDGHGVPDAEAVTTVDGDSGAVYVGAERDHGDSSQRRNSVLRYDTAGTGPLLATMEWHLDDMLPTRGANTGIEGLAWIADDTLVAAGLRDRSGRVYVPADRPAHHGGLFVVAIEQSAALHLVLLTEDGSASLVTTFPSGLPSVMELHWSAEHQELLAVCDDTCGGVSALVRPRDGAFEVFALVQSPSGSAALNDEGFARLPCDGATASVVWADDEATGGHVVRESVLPCAPLAELVELVRAPAAATDPATNETLAARDVAATDETLAARDVAATDDEGSGSRRVVATVAAVLAAGVLAGVWARRLRRS
jgi:hypothetical protein